jgi:hypothetical protein
MSCEKRAQQADSKVSQFSHKNPSGKNGSSKK